ncbi:MAG: S8 family serine peptidase, partial [Acetivibrionales bacterium]
MKRSMRFWSILLVLSILVSNGFSAVANPVFAANPMKKEKFLIKHASNDKLKEESIDPYIYEEPQITTEDSIILDKSNGLEVLTLDIETETNESDIIIEPVTEEISVVEATQAELAEIFEGIDVYNIEIDQLVSISGDIYPSNLQLIGEDIIDDPDFTGEGIKIAILDTGIDVDSSELNVAGGVSFIPGTSYDDDNGHGTALAGIIGACENGEGLIGIAPEAELYAVKVLDSNGKGYYSDVIRGLEWCMENRMDIVLMSFGADVYSGILHETVQKAYLQDILLIGAAGNSDAQVQYPAAYSEVMGVGATDENDAVLFSYSNPDAVDIYAIGENITSIGLDGTQAFLSGSSFSAAHVAGVAAEIWSKDPVKTNAMVRQVLIQSAENEDNTIPILDAYQAYLASTEEAEADPGDDITPIEDGSDEDAEVSALAICRHDDEIKLGKDIIIRVQFSGDHEKVIAQLYNIDTKVYEKTVILGRVIGGYNYEEEEYIGPEYAFNFGKATEHRARYIVKFQPYDKDENGELIPVWPFESDTFKIVAPDLVCTRISTDITDALPQKSMRVTVEISNTGDASFVGERKIRLYLIDNKNNKRKIGEEQRGNLGKSTAMPVAFYWEVKNEDVGAYRLQAEVEVTNGDEESNKNNNTIEFPGYITVSLAGGTYVRQISVLTSDPIDTASGNYTIRVTDMSISGKAPIDLIRSYNATDYKTSNLGPHWKHNFNIYYEDVGDYIKVYLDDGSVEFFDLLESGEYSFNKTKYKNVYYNSDGSFTIEFKGNKTYKFNEKYIGQITENANTTYITYEDDLLKKIESISGFIEFFYDDDRLDYIVDSAGRTVDY